MSKRNIFLLLLLAAVIIGVCIFFRTEKSDSNKIILYGNVDVRQFNVSFQVAGQIKKMYFEEGDYVAKGALMAELDDADYRLQVQQTESAVAKAASDLSYARATYEKYAALYERGAVAQITYENIEKSLKSAQASYDAAMTSKSIMLRQNDYSKLIALEDGVVTTRLQEPGMIVGKSSPVYALAKKDPVWVRAYISEKDLGNIYPGMEAQITFDAVSPETGKIRSYVGRIGYISPVSEFTPKHVQTVDLRSDLVYMIRVYIDKPDEFMRQGMPATVELNPGGTGGGSGSGSHR